MVCRTDGRTDGSTPDSGSPLLPQDTRFGWRRELDPIRVDASETPRPLPRETISTPPHQAPQPTQAPTEFQSGRDVAVSYGWRPQGSVSQLAGETWSTSLSTMALPQVQISTPRPLRSAPQPRLSPESVTASLKGSKPHIDPHPGAKKELWWPEGSNRTVSFIGPAIRAIPQSNVARTAMVAATVAAVASSAIFGPALAAAPIQAPSQATDEFTTVQTAGVATKVSTAVASQPAATVSDTGMGGAPGLTYVVKKGDTLHGIAAQYGVTTMDLINANNLPNPNLIYPGNNIDVPSANGGQDISITVKAGDTISGLATHYGVSTSTIVNLAANQISNPNLILIGQTLVIPGVNSSQSSSATQTSANTHATKASLASASAPQTTATQTKTKSTTDNDSQPKPTPATTQSTPTPKPAPTQATQQPAKTAFIWPVQGTITQKFGPTSFTLEPAYEGYAHFHQGLDIANSMYTPIHAAAAGTVIFSGWSNSGYGFCVQIDVGNGLITLYGHMAQQPSVSVGQHVSQGQEIGKMGSTGASTGPHLHFAIKKNGVWVDPLKYLP